MDEYISREALMDMLLEQQKKSNNFDAIGKIIDIRRIVAKIPAADAVEVCHGEWIIKTDYKTPLSHAYIRKEKLYICPYCAKTYRKQMNFCGNCGAIMDGKRKDGAEE